MRALFWELFSVGSFIFIVSYCLHLIAYFKGVGDEFSDIKPAGDKDHPDYHKHKSLAKNPIISKWFAFGGGYYGVVALVKLIFIEIGEIKAFIKHWPGSEAFVQDLGFGTFIAFCIEQFKNFIAAVMWPVDYFADFSLLEFGIFILITYYLYQWSKSLATKSLVDE